MSYSHLKIHCSKDFLYKIKSGYPLTKYSGYYGKFYYIVKFLSYFKKIRSVVGHIVELDLYNKNNNLIFQNNDVILVQPIIYRNKNLLEDFYSVHKTKILEDSSSFLSNDLKKDFLNHLNSNTLYPLNMFIVKKKYFTEYCENIFPWLEKCEKLFGFENLKGYGETRIYGFLAERFLSFWFNKNYNSSNLIANKIVTQEK